MFAFKKYYSNGEEIMGSTQVPRYMFLLKLQRISALQKI